jgi:hypothetical protein
MAANELPKSAKMILNQQLSLIDRRQFAELLNTITHERHAPRSSDVVRSLISRMFWFGIANGYEEIEYNLASGTERALDTLPKRTRYSDDARANRPGEFKRLWTVRTEWITTGRPLLGWQLQLRALTAQRGAEILQMRFADLQGDTHWIKPFAIRKRNWRKRTRPTGDVERKEMGMAERGHLRLRVPESHRSRRRREELLGGRD